MGMHAKTAYNHYKRLDAMLADLDSRARIYGLSFDVWLEERGKILYGIPRNLPRWARESLLARDSLRSDYRYHNDLEWVLVLRKDGTRVTEWNDLSESEAEEFRRGGRSGAHYWKGKDRVYSASRLGRKGDEMTKKHFIALADRASSPGSISSPGPGGRLFGETGGGGNGTLHDRSG